MRIFVQNQGMRKILPQAYSEYSEDKILSITPSLGEKPILQEAPTSADRWICPCKSLLPPGNHPDQEWWQNNSQAKPCQPRLTPTGKKNPGGRHHSTQAWPRLPELLVAGIFFWYRWKHSTTGGHARHWHRPSDLLHPLSALLPKDGPKNKKTENMFDNRELASISKALIPPCGVLVYS